MQVDFVTLAVSTAVSGVIGWGVKTLLDLCREYFKTSSEWRAKNDARMAKLDAKTECIMGATQTTMRATLIHNYEKYAERGWLTPEERASWCDMHDKYSAMGFNGLIDSYRAKLDMLEDREI